MSTPPSEDIWSAIQAELRRAVPESTYTIWLAGLRPRELNDEAVVLEAPSDARRWIRDRFLRVIQTSAAAVLGPSVTVDIVAIGKPHAGGALPKGAPELQPLPGHAVNPRHTFDQFVIGESNRLAHAAALAVAEQPGHAYNPLFIYGAPGLGKTHLLHAIANYVLAHGGGMTVRCLTVEDFTNAFLKSLHGGDVDAFKHHYRRADVLLVDDIQFLERKARTEEEFFHTFNALHQAGAQLVLTSDRLPRDMDGLAARLRERFECGLVTDMGAPDLEARMAILRRHARLDSIGAVDEAVLELIADRVHDNVRALEGALIRVLAYHSLTRRRLDAELAAHVLETLYPDPGPQPGSVRAIQEATCEAFGVSLDELLSPARSARLAWPRQVAMYLSRELTDETLPTIGRQFGGRSHTTVMHACKRAGRRMAEEPAASTTVNRLLTTLRTQRDDRTA